MLGLNLLKRSACLALLVLLLCGVSSAKRRHQGIWYRVRNGDTISHIAHKYRVSQESIINAKKEDYSLRVFLLLSNTDHNMLTGGQLSKSTINTVVGNIV